MSDCCSPSRQENSSRRDLVIIGGGSAAFAAALRAAELGASAVIINDGLPVGGTCVNVGCVPSKTLIRAAEAYHRAGHPQFAGIEAKSRLADFTKIIEQKRHLVESLRREKYVDVIADMPGVELVQGRACIVEQNRVAVNDQVFQADKILIATGVRPWAPEVPGLAQAGYLTNESAFELAELPASLIILGGRYVALETAQMFSRLGSRVTILQRSERILPDENVDLTQALTGYLVDEGIEIVTGVELKQVHRRDGRVVVEAIVEGRLRHFEAAELMAATGRRPNTDGLGLKNAGVSLSPNGFLQVNDFLEAGAKNIFGAGDVIGDPMFVYTAAYEGALAAENALGKEKKPRDYTALPWVIFTDPQVAGVGLDETEALKRGIEVDSVTLPLSKVPRSLAARELRGFIKLVRDRKSDRLVGARILASEGSELLMEVSLAIKFGIPVRELASSFHPYLTLSEGIKLAAIGFQKDVAKLSCCAA